MKAKAEIVQILAECRDCGKPFDHYKNGRELAAQHANEHNHLVFGQTTIAFEYDGRETVDPHEEETSDEKRRRIYYQDIVFHVCYGLDLIDGKKPGHGIACGTVDTPTTEVFDRMVALVKEIKSLRKSNERNDI